MPTLYLIAGPNGAGKTTFASRFLPEESGELEFIPVRDVRRRFLKTLRNFFNEFCPLADAWKLFDNSRDSLRLVAVQKNDRTVIRDRLLWSSMLLQAGVAL
jgi:predicted ABC-type ATPase